MALNFDDLFNKMLAAAKASLGDKLTTMSTLATTSLKTLAQNLVDVGEGLIDGSVSKEQAAILIDMQKNSLQTVLLTEEGLALVAAQAAINAVIGAVKDVVNAAVGFALV